MTSAVPPELPGPSEYDLFFHVIHGDTRQVEAMLDAGTDPNLAYKERWDTVVSSTLYPLFLQRRRKLARIPQPEPNGIKTASIAGY